MSHDIHEMPYYINLEPEALREKKDMREFLEREIPLWLSRGGKIKKFPMGYVGRKRIHDTPLNREQKEHATKKEMQGCNSKRRRVRTKKPRSKTS